MTSFFYSGNIVSAKVSSHSVTVSYASGSVRTYRGRVPFTVLRYLLSLAKNEGFNDCYYYFFNGLGGVSNG